MKLSAELDQDIKCCIWGSSSMLLKNKLSHGYASSKCLLVEFMNKRSLDDFWLLSTGRRCCPRSTRTCQTARTGLIPYCHLIMHPVCCVLITRPRRRTHCGRCGSRDLHWISGRCCRREDRGGLKNWDSSRGRLVWIWIIQEGTSLRSLIRWLHLRVT